MPAHPLQLAIDAQGPAGEIYVRPLESQGLAHPEPGREGQDVKSLMAVSGLACDAKERARLLGVERLYLFLPDLGRIHEAGGSGVTQARCSRTCPCVESSQREAASPAHHSRGP